MNREFKFRIPHFNKEGLFSYFSYWGTIDHKGEPSLDHGAFRSPGSGDHTKGWHEPWTGLLDKKTKAYVYEGDIVNVTNKGIYNGKKVVVYDPILLCYVLVWFEHYHEWKGSSTGMTYLKVSSGLKVEIVGHIHELDK